MVVKSFHDVFDDIQQLYSFSSSSVLRQRPRSVSEWKRLTSCHPESSPGDQFCFCVFVALELKKKDDFITDMPGVSDFYEESDHK